MDPDLILLQRMIAQTCFGNTALRGAAAGTSAKAEAFLARIRLSEVAARWQFGWLDDQTRLLQCELPEGRWGHARKALNLFLRDCFYNRWLGTTYFSSSVAGELEVPLDSRVATRLRAEHPDLPKWRAVNALEPKDSTSFQAAASAIAHKRGILRVHLDIEYWPEQLSAADSFH